MQENLCFFDVPYYFLQFLYREKDKDFLRIIYKSRFFGLCSCFPEDFIIKERRLLIWIYN